MQLFNALCLLHSQQEYATQNSNGGTYQGIDKIDDFVGHELHALLFLECCADQTFGIRCQKGCDSGDEDKKAAAKTSAKKKAEGKARATANDAENNSPPASKRRGLRKRTGN